VVLEIGKNEVRGVDLGLSVKWDTCNVGTLFATETGRCFSALPVVISVIDNLHDGKGKIPTLGEFEELRQRCVWNWTMRKGVPGMQITGTTGKSIFLPATGWVLGNKPQGSGTGMYWTSTPVSDTADGYEAPCFNESGFIRSTVVGQEALDLGISVPVRLVFP